MARWEKGGTGKGREPGLDWMMHAPFFFSGKVVGGVAASNQPAHSVVVSVVICFGGRVEQGGVGATLQASVVHRSKCGGGG